MSTRATLIRGHSQRRVAPAQTLVPSSRSSVPDEVDDKDALMDRLGHLESRWDAFQNSIATKNKEFGEKMRSQFEDHMKEVSQLCSFADNSFQEAMEDVNTFVNEGNSEPAQGGNMLKMSASMKQRVTMRVENPKSDAQPLATSPGSDSIPEESAQNAEEQRRQSVADLKVAYERPPSAEPAAVSQQGATDKKQSRHGSGFMGFARHAKSRTTSANAALAEPSAIQKAQRKGNRNSAGNFREFSPEQLRMYQRHDSIGTMRRQRITKFQELGITQSQELGALRQDDKIAPSNDIPKYIIMPNSDARVRWDLFMVSLILYYAVAVPIRVGFNTESPSDVIEVIFNLCFITDIALNFVTAQRVKGILIVDTKKIAKMYLQGWFWVDVIASFPFDIIYTSDHSGGEFRINKLLRMVRIFKLLRLLRLGRVMARLREYTKVNPSLLLLAKTSLMMFFLWHWSACLYWFIASSEEIDPITGQTQFTEHNKWTPWPYCDSLDPADLATKDEPCLAHRLADEYSYAFFWAVVSTTGVGWDIIPTTPLEVAFTSVMIVIGVMMSVTIIGSVTSTLQNINSAQQVKRQKMERIFSYLRSRMVPAATQAKIRGYFQYLWSYDVEIDEPFPLDTLPDSLQVEVAVEVNRHLIEKVPIFHGMSPEATFDIISSLVRKIYLPGDDIISEGDTNSREMYLLVRGKVKVLVDEVEVADLEEGAFFGENALLSDTPRNATVMAVDYCDVLMLPRKSFQACLMTHQSLRRSIEETAALRTKAVSRWKKAISAATWAVDQHPHPRDKSKETKDQEKKEHNPKAPAKAAKPSSHLASPAPPSAASVTINKESIGGPPLDK